MPHNPEKYTVNRSSLNQKPQIRTLTFTRPNNIRGSVHGKISAYQELWDYAELHRYKISLEGNEIMLELAHTNAVNTQNYIIDRLKELKCVNISFSEKWSDND